MTHSKFILKSFYVALSGKDYKNKILQTVIYMYVVLHVEAWNVPAYVKMNINEKLKFMH